MRGIPAFGSDHSHERLFKDFSRCMPILVRNINDTSREKS